MRYVIIGAGIAGTSAAETIRMYDPDSEITLVTSEPDPLYARITIAQYAAGTVQRENLFLRKVEQLMAKKISFFPNITIQSINRNTKQVWTKTLGGEDIVFTYDKLLIATGGSPTTFKRPGSDAKGIFSMYTLQDTEAIRSFLKDKRTALVSGGAFIGIDFVNVFLAHGMRVDFLIRGPRFLHRMFDQQASAILHKIIESKGVNIRVNEEIHSFMPDEKYQIKAVQTNQTRIQCDVVGIGHGIDRKRKFMDSLNLPFDEGLITNEYLQTLDPNIFAAGDVAKYFDLRFNCYMVGSDWFSARSQGVSAAKNMIGKIAPYEELVSNTSNIFGISATMIGKIENERSKSFRQVDGNKYIKIFTEDNIVIGGIVIGNNDYAFKLKLAIKDKRKMTDIAI